MWFGIDWRAVLNSTTVLWFLCWCGFNLNRKMDETKVIYHIDDEDTPYLVKLGKHPDHVTLGDFKNVLNRPSYKFFFKSMDDDFGWVCMIILFKTRNFFMDCLWWSRRTLDLLLIVTSFSNVSSHANGVWFVVLLKEDQLGIWVGDGILSMHVIVLSWTAQWLKLVARWLDFLCVQLYYKIIACFINLLHFDSPSHRALVVKVSSKWRLF